METKTNIFDVLPVFPKATAVSPLEKLSGDTLFQSVLLESSKTPAPKFQEEAPKQNTLSPIIERGKYVNPDYQEKEKTRVDNNETRTSSKPPIRQETTEAPERIEHTERKVPASNNAETPAAAPANEAEPVSKSTEPVAESKVATPNESAQNKTEDNESASQTVTGSENVPPAGVVVENASIEEIATFLQEASQTGGKDVQEHILSLLQSEGGAVNGAGTVDAKQLFNFLQNNESRALDVLQEAGLNLEEAQSLVSNLKQSLNTDFKLFAQSGQDSNTAAQVLESTKLDAKVKTETILPAQDKSVPAATDAVKSATDPKTIDKNVKAPVVEPADKVNLTAGKNDGQSATKEPVKSDFLSQFKLSGNPSPREFAGDTASPTANTAPPANGEATVSQNNLLDNLNKLASLQNLSVQNSVKTIATGKAGTDATPKTSIDTLLNNLNVQSTGSTRSAESMKSVFADTLTARSGVEKSVMDQMVEKFSLRGAGGKNEVFIRLDPPSLGSVRMNISTQGDNVRATVITETHAVKQAIENNLSQLRDSISDQGLKVESFTVMVGGNPGQKGNGQAQNGDSLASFFGDLESASSEAEEGDDFAPRSIDYFHDSQTMSVFA